MNRIRVTIDSLALKGFQPGDRFAVAAGLKKEIAAILSKPGGAEKLSRMGSVPLLRVGRVFLNHGIHPRAAGAAAGKAIGRRMGA
jgi:hypothetical protein